MRDLDKTISPFTLIRRGQRAYVWSYLNGQLREYAKDDKWIYDGWTTLCSFRMYEDDIRHASEVLRFNDFPSLKKACPFPLEAPKLKKVSL